MSLPKPFAESCEQNKQAILEILEKAFSNCQSILEIGSGTGQHAVFFSQNMPHLTWQTSELSEHHSGVQAWLDEADNPNILSPIKLDVTDDRDWPDTEFDGIFSANTVHIMSWSAVEQMYANLHRIMKPGSIFCLYGPFNYDGKFTSDSNARFDLWLKSQAPERGIRDFNDLSILADQAGLRLLQDYAMPANNRILVWQKI